MMITQQVVTYIKDQLARGTDRTKIRANLLSAGWMESDINQAFSFAEPVAPSAAVKIAPAFAIEEEVKPKNPIDKTEISVDPVMPILKKDSDKKEPSNLSAFAYENPAVSNQPVLNLEPAPISNPTPKVEVAPIVSTVKPEIDLNNIVKTPISNPAPIMQPAGVSAIRNTIETDVVRNFESVSGPALNPVSNKKSASPVLKIIAGILFIFLVFGNAYLWFVVLPGMQKSSNMSQNTQNIQNDVTQEQRQVSAPMENIVETTNVNNNNSISSELSLSISNLQSSATSYFSRYNSYGGVAMGLGPCSASGTVFSDNSVKQSLDEISRVTGRTPQCALSQDTSLSNRTSSYIIYVPMEDGGYCIDSMGASMTVNKTPTGTSCTTGL